MKYLKNGTEIGIMHIGQIAHSEDGTNWGFYSKATIKEISGTGKIIRLHFIGGDYIDINLSDIQDKPDWQVDASGLNTALDEISDWINLEAIDIDGLRNYLLGAKGFTCILPSSGLVSGSWYLIRTMDDTVFSMLKEFNTNLVGTSDIPSGFLFTQKEIVTTSDPNGDGFTQIQITSGKIIAYKK